MAASSNIHCAAGVADEQQLLVGCGVAPRGRLCRVRAGMALQPYILDGPEVPVSVISCSRMLLQPANICVLHVCAYGILMFVGMDALM